MSTNRDSAAVVGLGAAACAVCCAGPILGFLAAIGLGTAAGVAVFGSFASIIGAAIGALVLVRRRRRISTCVPTEAQPVHVELVRAPCLDTVVITFPSADTR